MFTQIGEPLLFRSLSEYAGVSDFCSWLDANDTRNGAYENPLTAMEKAVDDISANSLAYTRRFIVLVTDEYYDTAYQSIGRQELVDLLDQVTGATGGVYISVWEDQSEQTYQSLYDAAPSLAVNGGFDSIGFIQMTQELKYPFDRLSSRVLNGTR